MKPATPDNVASDETADKSGSSRRWKLLALVAPGLIAIEVAPVPWAVEGSAAFVRPRLARSIPGWRPVRVGRLVQGEPAGDDHFSTKARSMT